jgi:hypothetical protein
MGPRMYPIPRLTFNRPPPRGNVTRNPSKNIWKSNANCGLPKCDGSEHKSDNISCLVIAGARSVLVCRTPHFKNGVDKTYLAETFTDCEAEAVAFNYWCCDKLSNRIVSFSICKNSDLQLVLIIIAHEFLGFLFHRMPAYDCQKH